MSILTPELLFYSKYLTPPVVGAFIGYFTNKVAIKMLFRPLVAWKIGKIRVPMTPGVIPSKRKDLAKNMGEVVGDHLLTSDEIGKGLAEEIFQSHLHALIDNRISGIMQKDLGSISMIIPDRFQVYLDLGSKVVTYQVKEQLRRFIESPQFDKHIGEYLEQSVENALSREIESVLKGSRREEIYGFLEKNISRFFESDAMEQWVEDFIHLKVYGALQQKKTISEDRKSVV
jgi:uncharacterized membrane protein YheB (UPF0754 family)